MAFKSKIKEYILNNLDKINDFDIFIRGEKSNRDYYKAQFYKFTITGFRQVDSPKNTNGEYYEYEVKDDAGNKFTLQCYMDKDAKIGSVITSLGAFLTYGNTKYLQTNVGFMCGLLPNVEYANIGPNPTYYVDRFINVEESIKFDAPINGIHNFGIVPKEKPIVQDNIGPELAEEGYKTTRATLNKIHISDLDHGIINTKVELISNRNTCFKQDAKQRRDAKNNAAMEIAEDYNMNLDKLKLFRKRNMNDVNVPFKPNIWYRPNCYYIEVSPLTHIEINPNVIYYTHEGHVTKIIDNKEFEMTV